MYHTHAQKYLDHDIITFPLKGKMPASSKNWREFTEEDVEEAIKGHIGDFGIGVATGEESGMVLIDIDTEDSELQRIITDHIDLHFPSGMFRFGNRSRLPSLLYQYDGQFSKKIMYGKKAIIEILSDGRYCVVDGPHPEQPEPYEWNRDIFTLLPQKELWPSFTDHDIEVLREVIDAYFDSKENFEEENVSDYSFAPRVGGTSECVHDSHIYLFNSTCSYLDRYEGEELIDELIKLDDTINGSRGYCSYFEDNKRGGRSNRDRRDSVQALIDSTLVTINRQRKAKGLPEISPFVPIHLRRTKAQERLTEIGKKEIVVKKEKEKRKIPKAPKGALDDAFQAIYESSPIKRSRLSLCAALNIISTGIGTNMRFGGTYANIYSIIVAESGSGKNAPLKAIHSFLNKLKYYHLIGESNIVSTKGVIAELQYFPERCDVIDEFGGLLRKATERGSIVNGAFDMYNQLFSDVSGHFGGAKIDQGARRITYGACNHPYVNFVGATTPSAFSESFNEELFLQGWGSRSLLFCDTRYKPSPFDMSGYYLKVPDSVNRFFGNIRGPHAMDAAKTAPDIEGTGMKQTITPKDLRSTIDIEAEPDALKILREVHRIIEDSKRLAYENNDVIGKITYSRQFNQIKKVALISAAANNCINDKAEFCKVRSHDVAYAASLVNFLAEEGKEFLKRNMYKSNNDRILKKVSTAIEGSKDKGIDRSTIIGTLTEFSLKEVEDAIGFLSNFKEDEIIHKDGLFYSSDFVKRVEVDDD